MQSQFHLIKENNYEKWPQRSYRSRNEVVYARRQRDPVDAAAAAAAAAGSIGRPPFQFSCKFLNFSTKTKSDYNKVKVTKKIC